MPQLLASYNAMLAACEHTHPGCVRDPEVPDVPPDKWMELTALQAVKMLEHVRRLLSDSSNQKRENIKREATYKCDTCGACFYYPAGAVRW